MKKNLYTRWQQDIIIDALKTRRVLLLSGARQCGKTTLTKELELDSVMYLTLDNINILEAVKRDPIGFLSHNKSTMIIDEIQRVPELLLSIKELVDQNDTPGQFLLTGSWNIRSSPNINESLAGRIRKIRLRTMSQGEISGTKPNFLKNIFEQKLIMQKMPCSQDDIIKRALKGGYPEAIKLENYERKLWHKDYIASLLERDLKDIVNIRHISAMYDMISIMATWSSKFIDISAIGSHLSITRSTIETYINALESMYLVEKVRPWLKTDYQRVGKRSKIFMTDCGLMVSILNWQLDEGLLGIKFDSDKLGKLIETFVFNELSAQIDANPGEYQLYQYRDKDKREIDFIVERSDGSLIGIEVKSGSSINQQSFKHLKWFSKEKLKEKNFIGVVLYTGENILFFADNLIAIPISYFWL